jgi:sporulation protein YlmC with PRC-barrel domain
MKSAILAVALSVAAVPALAQGTTTPATTGQVPQMMAIEQDDMMVPGLAMRVDEVEDITVVDAAGETIGEVDEVLATSDGRPVAVVVEAGGFLGIGEKDVIVDITRLTKSGDNVVLNMSKAEIEALPAWAD